MLSSLWRTRQTSCEKKSSDLKNVYNILIIQVPWVIIWLKKSWLEFKLKHFYCGYLVFLLRGPYLRAKRSQAPLMKILCFRLCSFILQRDIQRRARFFQYLLSTSKKLFSVVSSLMKNIILPKHNICLFYSPIHIAVIIIKSAYWMVGSMGNDALIVHIHYTAHINTLILKSNLNTP